MKRKLISVLIAGLCICCIAGCRKAERQTSAKASGNNKSGTNIQTEKRSDKDSERELEELAEEIKQELDEDSARELEEIADQIAAEDAAAAIMEANTTSNEYVRSYCEGLQNLLAETILEGVTSAADWQLNEEEFVEKFGMPDTKSEGNYVVALSYEMYDPTVMIRLRPKRMNEEPVVISYEKGYEPSFDLMENWEYYHERMGDWSSGISAKWIASNDYATVKEREDTLLTYDDFVEKAGWGGDLYAIWKDYFWVCWPLEEHLQGVDRESYYNDSNEYMFLCAHFDTYSGKMYGYGFGSPYLNVYAENGTWVDKLQ